MVYTRPRRSGWLQSLVTFVLDLLEMIRVFFLTILDPKAAETLGRSSRYQGRRRPFSSSSFGGGSGSGGGGGGGGPSGSNRPQGKPPTSRPRFSTLSQLRDASGNCAAGEIVD